MSSVVANRFSAAGSALGYLAQVEYALLIALRRMDGDVSLRLSLETIDDITFELDGDARELWQSKHHIDRQGTLGDASPDLWKTIHNWIETANDESACFLLTTSIAPVGSAASLLRPDRSAQDVVAARALLDSVANAAGNVALSDYHQRYLDLEPLQRDELLARMQVLDGAVNASGLSEALIGSVRKSAAANRRGPLIERLRGWWHGRAMDHLTRVANGESDWIELEEIEERLLYIAQTLRDDNLPIDFDSISPLTDEEIREDDRLFVEQLQIILLHHDRIRQAVYDHNRAFLQRSRWQREQLLAVGELDAYDRRLIEEWNRVFLPVGADEGSYPLTEPELQLQAQELYMRLQQRDLPEIRKEVRSGYIPLGTLHMLADRLEIGWHPDWVERLRYRLEEASSAASTAGAA